MCFFFRKYSFNILLYLLNTSAKHSQSIGIMTPLAAALSALSHLWFPIDNSWRDVSISFKLHRMVKHNQIQVEHHKIQDKFEFGGHLLTLLIELRPFLCPQSNW